MVMCEMRICDELPRQSTGVMINLSLKPSLKAPAITRTMPLRQLLPRKAH